jgi:multicomponent Na+:H+ antiporter subunit D
MALAPVLGAINLLGLETGVLFEMILFSETLEIVRVDKLSLLFGYLFHLAAFIAVLFSAHVRDTVQQVSALLYAGSAIGAVFAGDLLTLFVFWELMTVSSVFLILARRTRQAFSASLRYLLYQVLSGVALLAGTLMLFRLHGSLSFGHIGLDGPASWLIFLAFGIKCGFPALHSWLVDSYPEATPTGTVFLSAFTTKVAVYALARGFAGTEALVYIGAAMTCFPIFYAVIENDLRRVLAYSMINQLGFMVVGIGIGTALAINGAVAHAFNDVIFKGLLMMSMGAVLYRTGKMNGSELGGLYKSMPKTTVLCLVGAASISAFPLFSGFVSKSMVMSAAISEGYPVVWLALLFASAGVFHHAGIKIPFFAFFAHDSGLRTQEAPPNMLAAMTMAAVICVVIGVYPVLLYDLLPFPMAYSAYDYTHVVAQLQLLSFSALAFVWLRSAGLYPPELKSVNLDVDWVFRRVLLRTALAGVRLTSYLARHVRDTALWITRGLFESVEQALGVHSVMATAWSTARMVFIVALLLSAILLFLYR